MLEMSDSRIRPTAKNRSKDKANSCLKTGRAILPQPPPSFPRTYIPSFPRKWESGTQNLKKPFYPISFRTDRSGFPLMRE
ncbi:hypothetical protein AW44_04075 [Neisseria gonorrhoeae]|nr:hypothetical protein AW44_04075 [Neisseria gonorrhoeae]